MKINLKKLRFIGLMLFVLVVMTGCVQHDASGNPTGFVYEYLGKPAGLLLDWLAHIFGNSYGIAIIIVTLITRIFMIPSMINMTKGSIETQAKMKYAQPEIDEIKEELEMATTQEEKISLNNEMMAVQKKYGINMLSSMSGCLPLLVQMPIISAVYFAIRSSDAINQSNFFGLNLGKPSLVITAIVAAVYAYQGWLSYKGMPQSDNPQAQSTSKSMMLVNPLMLGWITYASAAGLGVYFLTGGIFGILQQLYMNRHYRPMITAKVDEEMKKFEKIQRTPLKKSIKKTLPSDDSIRLIPTKNPVKSRRNEGKQRKK